MVKVGCGFLWQAQYLVKLECDFSRQAQHFVTFWERETLHFFVENASPRWDG